MKIAELKALSAVAGASRDNTARLFLLAAEAVDELARGKADKISCDVVAIPKDGWQEDNTIPGCGVRYDLVDESVTALDLAIVDVVPSSEAAATACGLYYRNETVAGAVRLYASSAPTSPITAQITIIRGAERTNA